MAARKNSHGYLHRTHLPGRWIGYLKLIPGIINIHPVSGNVLHMSGHSA